MTRTTDVLTEFFIAQSHLNQNPNLDMKGIYWNSPSGINLIGEFETIRGATDYLRFLQSVPKIRTLLKICGFGATLKLELWNPETNKLEIFDHSVDLKEIVQIARINGHCIESELIGDCIHDAYRVKEWISERYDYVDIILYF